MVSAPVENGAREARTVWFHVRRAKSRIPAGQGLSLGNRDGYLLDALPGGVPDIAVAGHPPADARIVLVGLGTVRDAEAVRERLIARLLQDVGRPLRTDTIAIKAPSGEGAGLQIVRATGNGDKQGHRSRYGNQLEIFV